jgi:hypothetical protein
LVTLSLVITSLATPSLVTPSFYQVQDQDQDLYPWFSFKWVEVAQMCLSLLVIISLLMVTNVTFCPIFALAELVIPFFIILFFCPMVLFIGDFVM